MIREAFYYMAAGMFISLAVTSLKEAREPRIERLCKCGAPIIEGRCQAAKAEEDAVR